jgi:serine/threonine protein kinase
MNDNDRTQSYNPDAATPVGWQPVTSQIVGSVLKDRYVIEKELTRGGMNIVLLAHDVLLHSRPVVVALLLEESARDAWLQKKFQDEIKALSLIDHPGIVGIIDAGRTADGSPFVVMQHIAGPTLRALIKSGGMEFATVARLMRDLCKAVGAAHRHGIIHCDLKPENIMLQEIGDGELQVKVIDFGIAKFIRQDEPSGLESTHVAGTPFYMAPEQLSGRPSPLSDVFALGVIAYEMLTGQRPFNPASPYQMIDTVRNGVKIRPRALRQDLPPAAEEVILKALSFDPLDRYKRATEFGELLSRALTSELELPTSNQGGADGALTFQDVAAQVGLSVKLAHVLFMDLVGYSTLPTDEQAKLVQTLNEVATQTSAYQIAKKSDELVARPTGDGMALAFFSGPEAPCQCAVQITTALGHDDAIKLRLGIHTGPVYRVPDVNGNEDIAGSGINIAQRVMDFGDAGHILLSAATADALGDLSEWRPRLHDLGTHKAKHGVSIHIYSAWWDGVGNPRRPAKFANRRTTLMMAAALIICLLTIGVLLVGLPAGKKPSGTQAAASGGAASDTSPKRALTYFITTRKNPASSPFQLPGEIIFEKGYQIRLNVESPTAGYLYIVNEGPGPGGTTSYNILFPLPTANNGSAALPANREVTIPDKWFTFDAQQGTEKVWLIWSASALPDIEALKQWSNPKDRGEIKSADQVKALEGFLRVNGSDKPEVVRDDENKTTTLKGTGSLLVYPVRLEHH